MGSFSTPLSGLTAAQGQLQSISNNLANLNTDGYKDQNVSFADIFAQTGMTNGSGDPLQTGSGVSIAATDSNFSEGNLNATGTASNMALSGDGFFVVQNASGGTNYTRSGDFTVNDDGQITTPSGELVLGYPAVNGNVSTTASLQPLDVGTGVTNPAVASTTMSITANLSADSAAGATTTSTLPVYDSLGNSHTVTVTYTMNTPGSWSYSVTVPSSDLTPAPSTTSSVVASGTLSFDSSGILTSVTPAGGAAAPPTSGIPVAIPPTGTTLADGAAPMNLTWNLESNGSPTITQTASASTTSATSTDGFASGTLHSYTVQSDGVIEGTFSSGQSLALGQVAIASFANNQGLADVGNNDYQTTAASGPAVIGVAGTGGRGTIVGGSVEQSNVNIATEFAKLIVAQQAYSANAKTITTFNQVSQTTIAMLQ
jgi:flagellar hook protein FlgE